MSGLLNSKGQPLRPVPPSGFYFAAACPHCNDPIFFHGGGLVMQQNPALQTEAKAVEVEPTFYTTCTCEIEESDLTVRVPEKYNLLAERQSLDMLFQVWHSLRAQYEHLTELKPVPPESGEVTDEPAEENDLGSDRESNILQFPQVSQGPRTDR